MNNKEWYINEKITYLIFNLIWILFFFSLVFLVDVKLVRYKLVGIELSIIILMGLWFWRDMETIKKIVKDTVLIPIIILAVIFTGFYIFSENRSVAYSQWQRMLFSAMIFFTAYTVFPEDKKEFLINLLLVMGGLISIYGVLQKSGGLWIVQVPKMNRVFATFGNPNFFASFLAGLIPLGAAAFWKDRKLWKLLVLIFMVAAIYHTATRGAWLGLMGAGVFWWIFWGRKKLPVWITVLLFILIAAFVIKTRSVWVRQLDRLLIWRDTLKMSALNPVFGVGLGEFYSEFPSYASPELLKIFPQGKFIVNYTHNEFLEVLAETGLIGFGIYIWFLSLFYYTAICLTKKNLIKIGAICGVTAILIHSAVSVNMRFAVSSIWVFFLMGLVLGRGGRINGRVLSLSYKRLFPASIFFLFLIFWGKKVVDPLVSHHKLINEVDFFDTEREYSRQELIKIIEEQPGKAIAYYKLGWIQAKDKEFKLAAENFKKAISIDDSLVGAYNNLGNIYYTIGQREPAIKFYNEAIKRNPNLTDAHFNLGYIYYYQGRLKKASREFNIVLKQDPENYKAKLMLKKMVE